MYSRARVAILSHLCTFSLQQELGGRPYPNAAGSRFDLEARPVVGDLVALRSAPVTTAFYLAWVEEPDEYVRGHLLRSVEDGQLSDWTNVGFMVFDRAKVAENPHWRWTDDQYAFADRWIAARHKAGLGSTGRLPLAFDGEACTLHGTRSGTGFAYPVPSWKDMDDAALAWTARDIMERSAPRTSAA